MPFKNFHHGTQVPPGRLVIIFYPDHMLYCRNPTFTQSPESTNFSLMYEPWCCLCLGNLYLSLTSHVLSSKCFFLHLTLPNVFSHLPNSQPTLRPRVLFCDSTAVSCGSSRHVWFSLQVCCHTRPHPGTAHCVGAETLFYALLEP